MDISQLNPTAAIPVKGVKPLLQPQIQAPQPKPFSLTSTGSMVPIAPPTQTPQPAAPAEAGKYTLEQIGERTRKNLNKPELAQYTDRQIGERMVKNKPELQNLLTTKTPNIPDIEQPKKEGFLTSLAKGVADVALQPARFLERAGKTIGEIGMSPETKAKVEQTLGPGLQEQIGGKDYATPAYTNLKQAAGGALQAGANLATPFVGGIGSLAAQGAALSGGKALEQDKSYGEAALSAGIGAATSAAAGKVMDIGGTVIGKGLGAIKEEARNFLAPVAKKLTGFMGFSKQEADMAFNKFPEFTSEAFHTLRNAGTPEEAQAVLKAGLLKDARTVYAKAKSAVENEFERVINKINAKYAEARGNVPEIARSVIEQLPKFGKSISKDAKDAMQEVLTTLQEPREYNLEGMRALSTDLWSIVEQTEQGTPARKAASSAWGKVRDEISNMTNHEIDPLLAKYSNFKDIALELHPALSENATEDTARNFVSNIATSSRTAAADALKEMEKLAGLQNEIVPKITVYRLAQRLAKDQKVTGSRLGELFLAGTVYTGGGALGEAVGGEKGKAIGQVAGGLLAGKALAPAALANIILPSLEKEAGIKMTGPIRQKIGEILSNPAATQIILRAIQGGPEQPKNQGILQPQIK